MARKIQPATPADVQDALRALEHLKEARNILRRLHAPKAVERVRLAINSAAGAVRHVERRAYGLASEEAAQ